MTTLKEIRKELKTIGFTVRTKQFSHGKHAVFHHIARNESLTFNVMGPEQTRDWWPFLNWQKENIERLEELKEETGLYGLLPTKHMFLSNPK
jgi:hypothetical protein